MKAVLLSVVFLYFAGAALSQERLAIQCGPLMDGKSDRPQTNVVVVVEGKNNSKYWLGIYLVAKSYQGINVQTTE